MEGKDLRTWYPARVEAVSEQGVTLIVGKPSEGGAPPTYGRVSLPSMRFDAATLDERTTGLRPGRFLELAFYGDEGALDVRSHRQEAWEDPDLPYLTPGYFALPAKRITHRDARLAGRGRLYVFVFGPGYGESVAVRVPPDEWLVIDSCRIEKQAAALHVLRRYGGKLALLLLTHRHKDHYRGFVDLIAWGNWNRIGCNDWRVADAEPLDVADPEDQLGAGLAQVLAEIQNQWRTRTASRLLTRRGASYRFSEGMLHILHPDEEFALANRYGEPNNLSAAAVLEWKGMSLLFGADVENPHWQGIAGHRANLGTHVILKVPHHASREAQDNCFLQGTPGRTWIVTPYNLKAGFRDSRTARGWPSSLVLLCQLNFGL